MSESPEMQGLETEVANISGVVDSAVAAFNGLAPMIEAAAGDRAASVRLAATVRDKASALATAIASNP